MKKTCVMLIVSCLLVGVRGVAGDLTVEGSLNVTSNLAARTLFATNAALGALLVDGPAVFAGTLQGDGSGLTNLPAGLAFWPPNPANATDFTYTTNAAANGIVITGYSEHAPADVVIPDYVNGLKVTEIGDCAFYGSAITSVSGGANVETIGVYAFRNCYYLDSVSLPSVTWVDAGAFYSCYSLTSVSLPSATWVDYAAFYCCYSLETISLPSVKAISGNVFGGCYQLTSVSLPSVTSIDYGSFYCCGSLTSLSLPSVTQLATYEFEYCSSLVSVYLPNVTAIGAHSFKYCSSLTSVSLPFATSVGEDSFIGCSALTTASLPAVTSIGQNSFVDCPALAAVIFSGDAPAVSGTIYGQTPNVTNHVTNPTAVGWGDTFGGRPVVRMSLYGDGSRLIGITGTNMAPGSVVSDSLAAGAVTSAKIQAGSITDAHVAADAAISQSKVAGLADAVVSLNAHLSAAGNPHGVTAAQVGAYTTNQTDSAIAQAFANVPFGNAVGTNHTGDVTISGSLSAGAFAGNGFNITNLNLAAYAGANLTWDAVSNKLNAAAGYGDSNAVAAIISLLPGLADGDDDSRWTGTADGLNAATGRASLGLGTAATNDTGAFAPSDLSSYASDTVTYSNGHFHATVQLTAANVTDAVLAAWPSLDTDAADDLTTAGGTLAGDLDMNSNRVKNLPTPQTDGDAVSKAYLQSVLSSLPPQGDVSMGCYTNRVAH